MRRLIHVLVFICEWIFFYTFALMKAKSNKTEFLNWAIFCVMAILLGSCKEKPKTTDIIVHKQATPVKKTTQAMSSYKQDRNVEWLGSTYKICVTREADHSLPLVVDESGNKYYDNSITVRILRSDGSVFFDRTFKKADFESYLSSDYADGALLGVVFDCVAGESLRFAASVGSPDRTSDEYEPLVVNVSRTGGVSVSKDTKLDTTSDETSDDEDDGV